jgi:predicted dehydrogenase
MLKGSLLLASLLGGLTPILYGQSGGTKTRLAVVGLDHDHVWGLLKDMPKEADAELVAIADPHPELVVRAKAQVPASVKFYSDYVKMLDEAKPEAVFATTSNDRHLEILKECAKRHIHYSTEKPMAANAAQAREMEQIARETHIKLMVNYWNAWAAPTYGLHRRVKAGEIGPVEKLIVQYGHQGPKEIGVSTYFAEWLYDPVKNGGGALIDFGCYGAEWALWLKGRPSRVYAYTLTLKTEQHNKVDDDATILLEYPDAVAVLQASWDWPYDKGQAEVFGPKGSLLATGNALLHRPAKSPAGAQTLDGNPVEVEALPHEKSNPVSYLVYCIRNDKPVEDPLAAELNVGVVEILDAAKESIRSGKAVSLPEK